MLKHYFKVAFRNMWKYRNQTLVSVIGLTVGFTCFALAALWIRYEMSYDDFHKDADRIYCVNIPDLFSQTEISRSSSPYVLAGYLDATFPEITKAVALIPLSVRAKIADTEYPVAITMVDSAFFSLFDVRLIEGNMDFLIPESKKLAVTQKKAYQMFGNESAIGKMVRLHEHEQEYTICAVVSGFPKQSNYFFDFLGAIFSMKQWCCSSGENILLQLAPSVNAEVFRQKLYKHEIKQEERTINNITLIPLTQMRYTDASIRRDVKFRHILIFALSGSLLILCSLLNYLMLFLCRFRIRQKELALRIVCGASERSLFMLLSLEFSLSLIAALLLGGIFIQILYEPFRKLSEISLDMSAVYGESALYILTVTALSLLVFGVVLRLFRRKMLNAAIRHGSKNHFRKVSVVVQLFISIGFIFCTTTILKQMYFLHHTTDLGFEFKNRGSMWTRGDTEVLKDRVAQLPEITEALCAHVGLIPQGSRSSYGVYTWDEKPEDATFLYIEELPISEQYAAYYGMRLTEGELLRDSDPDNLVLINESAMKAFGWKEAVGKKFGSYTVKGVIKNIYNFAPTTPVKPFYYTTSEKSKNYTVLFRYEEGTWKTCREKIEKIIRELHPENYVNSFIYNAEEVYDKYLQSENALLKILSFVSAVCVVICVFGFVSLISMTCEERRKEMAIRKIHGATAKDILDIFFNENFLLLILGSAVAFVVGHYIMRQWLEQYMLQTDIPAWIYVSITGVMALVIVACVGWRVYKVSVENPAEVIKSE
jgi:hypothetical protein